MLHGKKIVVVLPAYRAEIRAQKIQDIRRKGEDIEIRRSRLLAKPATYMGNEKNRGEIRRAWIDVFLRLKEKPSGHAPLVAPLKV